MLKESVEWEEEENLPLHYNASDLIVKGRCKSVHLPRELTGDLAEEVGIHISDGYMKRVAVVYCGHEEDDEDYLRYRVSPLLKRIWGLKKVGWRMQPDNKCLKLKVYSRRIVLFKEKVLGLPCGAKEGIQIPERLLMRRSLVRRLLSGLFDGDGSISFKSKDGLGHTYPVINFASISERLIRQVQDLLRKLGFILPTKLSMTNERTLIIQLNGDRNYERWMNLIGFNNPKHLTKVVLYENFGMVPPNTGLVERVKLIRGAIELSTLYPVEKLRVNNNRITEKKVLEALAEGKNHIKELGRLTSLDAQIVKRALIRLTKMGLVKRASYRRGASKKYYKVTRWGFNKLKRIETIVKRLREEFQLAL
jgi:DNA-binding MarR family transcriptional regulator